jgi:hypothetical protein
VAGSATSGPEDPGGNWSIDVANANDAAVVDAGRHAIVSYTNPTGIATKISVLGDDAVNAPCRR